tara:strand:- start:3093 stop:3251 length:159 start_codon:yes stop_codon:yes gene_type:complete
MIQKEYNNVIESALVGMDSDNVEEAFAIYNMACVLQELYPKLEEARLEDSDE